MQLADFRTLPNVPRIRVSKPWLLEGMNQEEQHQSQHPWWQVVCVTGVDYFSTLGYQPGLTFLAAGLHSPIATLVLVLLTLFGALPMYKRVAKASPHGEGSIAMLEHLLSWWQGKFFVLALLGFAATAFIITITLSASDAATHLVENPLFPESLHIKGATETFIAVLIISILGGVFLKGFKEAVYVAVRIVLFYGVMNCILLAVCGWVLIQNPAYFANWYTALFTFQGSPFIGVLLLVGDALLKFPKIALGLSGFETGVVVMPMVAGKTEKERIANTGKMLQTAAIIMSVILMLTSIETTLLIPPEEFAKGGEAHGRALAYLAHLYLGELFGTFYDLSTILILGFAGASAMAGLLNIIPRYLPRFGMAPELIRAFRPLTLIITTVCVMVTMVFHADVQAQGGAYATGVLVLMMSATFAVMLDVWYTRYRAAYITITAIFAYTTIVNVVERFEGLLIALVFIVVMIVLSIISRIWRNYELRVKHVEFDDMALLLLHHALLHDDLDGHLIRFIGKNPNGGTKQAFDAKLDEVHRKHLSWRQLEQPFVFVVVNTCNTSDFTTEVLQVRGSIEHGYWVLRCDNFDVQHALNAIGFHVMRKLHARPRFNLGWTEGIPLIKNIWAILFGKGDIASDAREIARRHEPDPDRRPIFHTA